MCTIEVHGYCKVWEETRRKARKSHVCDSCYGPINKGDIYLRHFNVFEGTATSEKCCIACADDREIFYKAHGGVMFQPSMFQHSIYECIGEDAEYGEDDELIPSEWQPMLDRLIARKESTHAPQDESHQTQAEAQTAQEEAAR